MRYDGKYLHIIGLMASEGGVAGLLAPHLPLLIRFPLSSDPDNRQNTI
ncbi:hypothetical protein MMIC_P0563 [Mariprofundus micogutta]|uniref:Uncharacterized protein n=1 Tax=Mariprofundus micogutta TaxID=1921010 RepID=A0A1L8CL22_9PROT|nr:hypothetical protein MMIC_P0563 [Mariprofundus micogutta]